MLIFRAGQAASQHRKLSSSTVAILITVDANRISCRLQQQQHLLEMSCSFFHFFLSLFLFSHAQHQPPVQSSISPRLSQHLDTDTDRYTQTRSDGMWVRSCVASRNNE